MFKNTLGKLKVFLIIFISLNVFSIAVKADAETKCDNFIFIKDWNSALKCVNDLKKDHKDWYYPLYLEAKINLGMNKQNEFLSALDSALKLASKEEEFFRIYYEYSHFYLTRWKDKSDKEKAEQYCILAKCNAIRTVGSNSIYELFLLSGKIAYFQRDFRSAEKDFRKAYDLNENVEIVQLYTTSLLKLGKIEEAFKVLKVAPKNSYTYGLLGEIYLHKGDFKKAIEAAEAGLKINSRSLICLLVRAEGFKGESNWEMVIVSLTKAIYIAPKNWSANALIGEAYLKLGNPVMAINYLRKACYSNDNNECQPCLDLSMAYSYEYENTKNSQYSDKALWAYKTACKQPYGNCCETIKSRPPKGIIEINCDNPRNFNNPDCKEFEKIQAFYLIQKFNLDRIPLLKYYFY